MRAAFFYLAFIFAALISVQANAQDELFGEDKAAQKESTADEDFLGGKEKPEIEAPVAEQGIGLKEDPNKPYFSVGARFRWIMIPEWLISAFGVDTKRVPGTESNLPLISNIGIGPEFIYRKGGFDITAAIWFAGLGWDDPISFKGEDERDTSWERVSNDMKAILLTVDFMWSTNITDWVAIIYGVGLGLGIPWGNIVRNEARQYYIDEDGNRKTGDKWEGVQGCDGESDPDPWCGEDEQYGEVWDKLKVVPWLNFLAGARFKPHRNVAIYVDGGFGIGFQLGLRGGYIF